VPGPRPVPLPAPQYYEFAGRWPSAEPERQELFYTGGAGHYPQKLSHVELQEDGKLDFFIEYQGYWQGLILP
jgi:hypothetical protein